MFNERDALKNRLEQLVIMEEKTINMYKEERKEIFDRLRELDSQEDTEASAHSIIGTEEPYPRGNSEEIIAQNNMLSSSVFNRSSADNEELVYKKGYHKKTLTLRNATINILKNHSTAIPLQQLKKELETETGIEMKNISLFMTNLVKKEENIKKVTHGQYMYFN